MKTQELLWEDGKTVALYTLKNEKIEADILTLDRKSVV